jgi:hypothetical protein
MSKRKMPDDREREIASVWEGDKYKYGEPTTISGLLLRNHHLVPGSEMQYVPNNQTGFTKYAVVERDTKPEHPARINPVTGKYLTYEKIASKHGGRSRSKTPSRGGTKRNKRHKNKDKRKTRKMKK